MRQSRIQVLFSTKGIYECYWYTIDFDTLVHISWTIRPIYFIHILILKNYSTIH